jgi:glycosyltransferase involved in cell wall biosynthesis
MNSFSVLISLYEKENPNFLRTALDSIFNQSLLPSEVILVKDGPLTIELDKIVEDFKDRHSILKVISISINGGLGDALKLGLESCANELVARMDTDDIAVFNRFEKQINFMISHPEISIVGGWIEEFEKNIGDMSSIRRVPSCHSDIVRFMKWRNPFNHMTVMFRKSAILDSGNYQHFFLLEDYYLWIRLFLKGYKFANLPEVLVYARGGLNMLSRRGGSKYVESERNLLRFLYREKVINRLEYTYSFISKTFVRLMGAKGRSMLYRFFLR